MQNSYAQSQSSSSVKQTGSQLYQQAVPLKISSYSKEHETEKKVVSSQGPLSFASENIVSQYTDVSINSEDTTRITEVVIFEFSECGGGDKQTNYLSNVKSGSSKILIFNFFIFSSPFTFLLF